VSKSEIVNDVTIQAATANGSGSQSANLILTRTIFRMGIPVGPKNLFPSNIQGLPTWFTIRVNKDGYVARRKELDILVALNPDTFHEDIKTVRPNGVILYESDLPVPDHLKREDILWYPIPFAKLAKEKIENRKLRKLLTNMMYVGALAEMLDLDSEALKGAVETQFSDKPKAIEPNLQALEVGREYFRESLKKEDPYRLKSMNENEGKIMMDGNTAGGLGALMGGCTVLSWYPITPSSSYCESLISFFKKYRKAPDGSARYAVVQAEDELASAGIVTGAGWAGARALTATSGPGISLMSEFVGLNYFAEIPGVYVNVQRMGPSTGLPTRTSQGDTVSTYYLSHGDCRQLLLFPGTLEEVYEFSQISFDLAERFQAPVFLMSDLDLGMNQWMTKPFQYPERSFDRGKVLNAKDLEKLGGSFARYKDVDGDGIGYRTLPGTDHPGAAFFTRGTGHNEKATYSEKPEDWKSNIDRLRRKFENAREAMPAPVADEVLGAKIGLLAYGSTDQMVQELRDQLKDEKGVETSYMRLRALPFGESLKKFIENHERVYVMEQNPSGQLCDIMYSEIPEYSAKLRKALQYDGMPVDARTFFEQIENEK
jgi:2-oxoglutarate ferredoxin oxidoreductase subunit alpha